MAVDHVKVHQVYKAQTCKILGGIVGCVVQAVGIGLVIDVLSDAPTGKDIVDLAYADTVKSRFLHCVQDRIPGRLQREVVAVGGALISTGGTHKGPGDHSAHAVPAGKEPAGDTAVFVKLLRRYDRLMGGDLKYGVGGGVDDQIPSPNVLVTKLRNGFGAGHGKI